MLTGIIPKLNLSADHLPRRQLGCFVAFPSTFLLSRFLCWLDGPRVRADDVPEVLLIKSRR